MTADEKAPKKPLPTGAIPIQIAGRAGWRSPFPSTIIVSTISSTPPLPGGWLDPACRRASWLSGKKQYYVGERVRLAVVLRNVSTQPIWFWHETSFAFLEPPNVIDAAGKRMNIKPAQEAEWRTLARSG